MTGKARRARRGAFTLGVVSIVTLAQGPSAVAQHPIPLLTVQPRTMATGTQNPEPAEYELQSASGADEDNWVFVPPKCAGATRCPLLIFLSPARAPLVTFEWLGPVANRYGMIVLSTGGWAKLDGMLKELLQHYAIDPEKIAIIGHCGTGSSALQIAAKNLHVFSRAVSMSSPFNDAIAVDAQNTTAEFLIDRGLDETSNAHDFNLVSKLQQEGHPARFTVTIRDHAFQAESFELVGRWLHESWTKPPAERTAPTVIEPLPLLTTKAVAQMTTFWTRFFQLPDSAWTADRRLPYLRDVVAPIGQVRTLIPMTDMAALAAHHPSVATALQQAGFTGQQHDAYRLALLTAILGAAAEPNRTEGPWPRGPINIDSNSILAQNIVFVKGHPDELETLQRAGQDPDVSIEQSYQMRSSIGTIEEPLGIWLTP